MHALQSLDYDDDAADAPLRHATLPSSAAPSPPASYVPAHAMHARRGFNWRAGAGVALAHGLLLGALLQMEVIDLPNTKRAPTVVNLIELPDDPPPAAPPPPEAEVEPFETIKPVIVAPPPIVRPVQAAPPVVATVPEPPPVRTAIVAPPQAALAPVAASGPVSVADLSSTLVSGKPPKYPIESRRKREEGTVVLTVLVATTGNVADVSVLRTSGFPRLDKAALDAVRRWRWSPTVRDGVPVMVKGVVDFPFVLRA
jgi:periplasmic protein TonB